MRKGRLFPRLLWSMLSVGILTALVVTVRYDRVFTGKLHDAFERELHDQVLMLEALAHETLSGAAERADLQARLAQLGSETTTHYTVVGADGWVVADSERDPTGLENHAQRPEVVAARAAGAEERDRLSLVDALGVTYVAKAVRAADGTVLGVVRTSRSTRSLDNGISANRRQLAYAALVAVAAAGLLAWWLARGVARPVAHLQSIADAMARGEDRARAALVSDDEFGALSRALNSMADRLGERVEEMRRERAKMSAIVGSMVEGVVAVDGHEHVLHLNAAASDMLAVADADVVGRPLIEVMRIVDICDMVTAVLGNGEKTSRELTIHKGADPRIVQLEAAPLRDRDGIVNGAVVVLHDVTDLRRLEAMRRDFVANVSHELKTPLTAIKGMVDTMVDDTTMPADVRVRFLGKIQRQCDRLASLVTDLLVLARIESSKASEELLPLDLRDPVRESAHQLAPAAHEKHLRLELVLPDAPVMVNGEQESLRQVVDNLLGNAIRYTPEHGSVTVTLAARGHDAFLAVRDTGIGIEAQHLDRIFERFYRVDKARSRELGGTGLGLAIVKHVALSHGGTVTVQSRPGSGSAFNVRIPLAPVQGGQRLVS
ncbi:MAG: ATP-binding protein [Planctomycetota bacterium]